MNQDHSRNEGQPPTVLIVDDESNIVLSLEFLLQQAGYTVEVAATGGEALAKIESSKPDLMLLDVMLPEVDGFEICRRIRTLETRGESHPRTRIILLTAKGQEAERRKGLELGADRYITKPFSIRDLMAAVREELEAR